MDTIDDPLDFETTELQTLDENFRCPICKEFYDTAMILSTCSHSFCAMCIRRSLAAEQCCPKCRAPGHDSNLHNNYDLDNVIHAWKLARKKILELQETTGSYTSQTTIQQEESSHVSQMESTCSTRRSTRLKTVSSRTEDPDLVTCPICQQKMHMLVLNQHVDRCLDGDSTIPPLPSKPTTLGKKKINTGKKPIKIVYDMYKDKDLRRMLKDMDLPDHGDRSLLIWRYKEYVTMYNANMDSSDPMDIKQLIRQLQAAETLQFSGRTTTKRSAPDAQLHKQKYDDEYRLLIDKARKKSKQKTSNGTGESSKSKRDDPADNDFQ